MIKLAAYSLITHHGNGKSVCVTMFMSSINQNDVTTSFIGSYFGTFLECTHPLNVTLFVIGFFFFSLFACHGGGH